MEWCHFQVDKISAVFLLRFNLIKENSPSLLYQEIIYTRGRQTRAESSSHTPDSLIQDLSPQTLERTPRVRGSFQNQRGKCRDFHTHPFLRARIISFFSLCLRLLEALRENHSVSSRSIAILCAERCCPFPSFSEETLSFFLWREKGEVPLFFFFSNPNQPNCLSLTISHPKR